MTPDRPRRRWLAVFPLLAVGLLMVGGGLTSKGLDQPITGTGRALRELSIAAAHADRLFLTSTLIILGLGVLGAALAAIATLTHDRRGEAVATTGAGIALFGVVCGVAANMLVGIDLAGASQADVSQQSAARVLVAINTASVSEALLVAYVAGLAVGSVLIGIGLWQSQRVSRWLAAGVPLTVLIGGAAPPGPVNVVLTLPLALVMVLLAREVWRAAPAAGQDGRTLVSHGGQARVHRDDCAGHQT
jgi:hypothetical protein